MKLFEFKAPFLKYDDIRLIAEDFLGLYNTEDEIPVQIEDIIELKLGIDIIPIPGLKQRLEVDGCISNDFKSITVDKFIYENFINRCRFTLAHEIGHMIMHSDLYESIIFTSIEEFKKFVNSVDPKQYSLVENQAYQFAGLVLVPEHHLKKEFEKSLDIVKKSGFDLDTYYDSVIEFISRYLQEKFNVSDAVIFKRLKYDGLIESY